MNPQENQEHSPQASPDQPQPPVIPQAAPEQPPVAPQIAQEQPPVAPVPSQQPEMSAPPTGGGKNKKLIIVAAVAVLLLGGAGAGAWYVYGNTAKDDSDTSKATDTPTTTDDNTSTAPNDEENATITKGTGIFEGATIYTYIDKKIPASYPSFLPKLDYQIANVQKTVLKDIESWTVYYTGPTEGSVKEIQETLTTSLEKQGFEVSETTSYNGHIQIDHHEHEGKKYAISINIVKSSEISPAAISVTSIPEAG